MDINVDRKAVWQRILLIKTNTFSRTFFAREECSMDYARAALTSWRLVINTGHMKISATEFKAKCLSLIDHVHDSGQPILITKHGKVVASLVAQEDSDQKPWLKLRGSVTRFENPFQPAIDEHEIESLK
jgi:prevent-host-death family protein